jgi:ribulose-5-phosphate 4-epimerase/fuculose-1-phosphate aldolase
MTPPDFEQVAGRAALHYVRRVVRSGSRPESADAVDEVVAANRVLARLGIVDGFGHVSTRVPGDEQHFLISRSLAPALVGEDDVMTLDVDGRATAGDERRPYLERHIHGEIYRVRPDVSAVVHSHAPSVLPFTISPTPLRAAFHLAAFLGAGAPVFDIAERFGATDMLVRTPPQGAALAEALGEASAVLMRGHGFVTVGASVPEAVVRAVYTTTNAAVLQQAMALGGATRPLEPDEAALAEETNRDVASRAWELWRSEVTAADPRGGSTAWTSTP